MFHHHHYSHCPTSGSTHATARIAEDEHRSQPLLANPSSPSKTRKDTSEPPRRSPRLKTNRCASCNRKTGLVDSYTCRSVLSTCTFLASSRSFYPTFALDYSPSLDTTQPCSVAPLVSIRLFHVAGLKSHLDVDTKRLEDRTSDSSKHS